MRQDAVGFVSRDDNSRILPGKTDTLKVGKGKQQKRALNDYMHNLYLKYKAESNFSISLSTLCQLHPRHISLVNCASTSICLCAKHQNFSFKLRTLKTLAVSTGTSADTFGDTYKDSEDKLEKMLEKIPDENITFQQWKREKLQNGKERIRIVENN